LIELVVVIVILGILAAAALPKFVNLSSDARAAVIKGAKGALAAANTMLHAKAELSPYGMTGTTASSVNVNVGGTNIATVYGFARDLRELVKITDIEAGSGKDFDVSSGGGALMHSGAKTPWNCSVTYTPPSSVNDAPVYEVRTSGC
jgi:MSHA pilin protein MshA